MIAKLYIYHPYQYNYFNNILSKDKKLNYEIDTSHLSRIDAINDVLKYIDLNDKNTITKLGSASWSPLEDLKYVFSKNELKKILFTGTSDLENADFIYTNFMYELDPKFNKKYQIPKNFYLYKSVIKDGTLIYSLYKKK